MLSYFRLKILKSNFQIDSDSLFRPIYKKYQQTNIEVQNKNSSPSFRKHISYSFFFFLLYLFACIMVLKKQRFSRQIAFLNRIEDSAKRKSVLHLSLSPFLLACQVDLPSSLFPFTYTTLSYLSLFLL